MHDFISGKSALSDSNLTASERCHVLSNTSTHYTATAALSNRAYNQNTTVFYEKIATDKKQRKAEHVANQSLSSEHKLAIDSTISFP